MEKEELFQRAKEIGWKVEANKKQLIEEDQCSCGQNIEFIETEKQAEVVLSHMISHYIEGMKQMAGKPESQKEPSYIG